jgi:hypothetical protein
MTNRKQGSTIRAMVDVHAPPIALLAKIGSILARVEEGAGEGGGAFDWPALRSLLADREVQDWLAGMRDAGLLPKPSAEATTTLFAAIDALEVLIDRWEPDDEGQDWLIWEAAKEVIAKRGTLL